MFFFLQLRIAVLPKIVIFWKQFCSDKFETSATNQTVFIGFWPVILDVMVDHFCSVLDNKIHVVSERVSSSLMFIKANRWFWNLNWSMSDICCNLIKKKRNFNGGRGGVWVPGGGVFHIFCTTFHWCEKPAITLVIVDRITTTSEVFAPSRKVWSWKCMVAKTVLQHSQVRFWAQNVILNTLALFSTVMHSILTETRV